jgi:DNA-binding MarR family transcriptional regulator
MRELADGLHCDPSNITGIVDRLGDRGLVERGSAPGDRRVKTLMLTEEGTALRMRLLDRLSEPPPGLGKLPVDEQRQLRGPPAPSPARLTRPANLPVGIRMIVGRRPTPRRRRPIQREDHFRWMS